MKNFAQYDLVLVFSFLASTVGVASVLAGSCVLAWVAIAAADLYLISVLIICAMLSDDEEFAKRHKSVRLFFSPRRAGGLLTLAFMMLAIVSGFAGLYVGTGVFSSSKTPLDALYISFFTMGFSDYSPTPGYGQLVVIAELVSGLFLLAGAFPLLLSRISTFQKVSWKKKDTSDVNLIRGIWRPWGCPAAGHHAYWLGGLHATFEGYHASKDKT